MCLTFPNFDSSINSSLYHCSSPSIWHNSFEIFHSIRYYVGFHISSRFYLDIGSMKSLVIYYNAPPTFLRHVFYRIPMPPTKYQTLSCSLDWRCDLNYYMLGGLIRETKREQKDCHSQITFLKHWKYLLFRISWTHKNYDVLKSHLDILLGINFCMFNVVELPLDSRLYFLLDK